MTNIKTILITGSNRGIGLELVKESLSKNFSVIGTFRNKENSQELFQLNSNNIELFEMNVVDEKASFFGNITAQEIIVEGQIKADISAEKLHVMSTGKVEGDLLYRTLKIDEGGYLNSSKVIKMSDQKIIKSKVLKS